MIKTFKEFNNEEIVVEGSKVNYDKLNWGDVYEVIQEGMDVTVSGAPAGASIEKVFAEMIEYCANATIETWVDNNMEIDDDIRDQMASYTSGVKVKIKH